MYPAAVQAVALPDRPGRAGEHKLIYKYRSVPSSGHCSGFHQAYLNCISQLFRLTRHGLQCALLPLKTTAALSMDAVGFQQPARTGYLCGAHHFYRSVIRSTESQHPL